MTSLQLYFRVNYSVYYIVNQMVSYLIITLFNKCFLALVLLRVLCPRIKTQWWATQTSSLGSEADSLSGWNRLLAQSITSIVIRSRKESYRLIKWCLIRKSQLLSRDHTGCAHHNFSTILKNIQHSVKRLELYFYWMGSSYREWHNQLCIYRWCSA